MYSVSLMGLVDYCLPYNGILHLLPIKTPTSRRFIRGNAFRLWTFYTFCQLKRRLVGVLSGAMRSAFGHFKCPKV